MSKVQGDCVGFALLRSVIGLKNARHLLNQSDAKLKPIATWSLAFSRAWGRLHVFTLTSHWLLVMSTLLLIGRCNDFGFDFTTLNRKALYINAGFVQVRNLESHAIFNTISFFRPWKSRKVIKKWRKVIFFRGNKRHEIPRRIVRFDTILKETNTFWAMENKYWKRVMESRGILQTRKSTDPVMEMWKQIIFKQRFHYYSNYFAFAFVAGVCKVLEVINSPDKLSEGLHSICGIHVTSLKQVSVWFVAFRRQLEALNRKSEYILQRRELFGINLKRLLKRSTLFI